MGMFLKISVAGLSLDNPFAGFYSGKYIGWDSSGLGYTARLSGMISGNGEFNFHLEGSGATAGTGWLNGRISIDGVLDTNRVFLMGL